ncbi:MAG: nucleotidyltransferase family protein [Alphaproteobacteria bacterium]|nr:nucleotidyltransferase family protein [Alphaproteobacteria bacterium]
MSRLEEVLEKLRGLEPALRARGVGRLAVFGSTARGEERPDSDVDILFDWSPGAKVGVTQLFDVQDLIEGRLAQKVDLLDAPSIKPAMRDRIIRESVNAF